MEQDEAFSEELPDLIQEDQAAQQQPALQRASAMVCHHQPQQFPSLFDIQEDAQQTSQYDYWLAILDRHSKAKDQAEREQIYSELQQAGDSADALRRLNTACLTQYGPEAGNLLLQQLAAIQSLNHSTEMSQHTAVQGLLIQAQRAHILQQQQFMYERQLQNLRIQQQEIENVEGKLRRARDAQERQQIMFDLKNRTPDLYEAFLKKHSS